MDRWQLRAARDGDRCVCAGCGVGLYVLDGDRRFWGRLEEYRERVDVGDDLLGMQQWQNDQRGCYGTLQGY